MGLNASASSINVTQARPLGGTRCCGAGNLPLRRQSVPRRRAYTSTEPRDNGHEADALRAVPWASPLEHYASAGKAAQAWCVCSEQSAQQQCCLPRRRQHIPERAQNTGACVRGSFVRLRHCQATTQCLTAVLRLRRPQNFALVDEQVVRFTPGLNVITGASGSGKSVLVRVCRPCAVDSLALRVDLVYNASLTRSRSPGVDGCHRAALWHPNAGRPRPTASRQRVAGGVCSDSVQGPAVSPRAGTG